LQPNRATRERSERQDSEERARRKRAWEAMTDKPDVESFLAASKCSKSDRVKAGKVAAAVPKVLAVSNQALKISIAQAERKSRAAGSGARPKAAITATAAQERRRRQLDEDYREESSELSQGSAEDEDRPGSTAERSPEGPPEGMDFRLNQEVDTDEEEEEEECDRRTTRREERRKREEWRKRWREERTRRDDERRRQALRETQRSRSRPRPGKPTKCAGNSSCSSSSPNMRRQRQLRKQQQQQQARRRTIEQSKRPSAKFLAVMSQMCADKAASNFSGQISDAELEKRLRRQSASSSGEPLMSEAQVLAKMQKARSRGGGR